MTDVATAARRLTVLLVDGYESLEQPSMRRYAEMLERELPAVGVSVVRRQPAVVLGRLAPGTGLLAQVARFVDLFLLGPIAMRDAARHADVVHICDHTNSMYRLIARGSRAVATCHDLHGIKVARGEVPGIHASRFARLHQRWIAFNLARVPHVLCVSRATERELRRSVPGLRGTVTVIENPLSWPYSPAPARDVSNVLERFGVARDRKYFLHVGNNVWYKNRLGAMRIFAELRREPRYRDAAMLMVGAPLSAEMQAFRRDAGLEDGIIELTNVSNEELRALYTGATALLFPSLREGFGWPIIEAQACGCAVITSSRAPMTDVGGDAAIYVDPDYPGAAAAAIIARESDLPSLRERSLERAALRSTQATMQQYAALYASVAGVTAT